MAASIARDCVGEHEKNENNHMYLRYSHVIAVKMHKKYAS